MILRQLCARHEGQKTAVNLIRSSLRYSSGIAAGGKTNLTRACVTFNPSDSRDISDIAATRRTEAAVETIPAASKTTKSNINAPAIPNNSTSAESPQNHTQTTTNGIDHVQSGTSSQKLQDLPQYKSLSHLWKARSAAKARNRMGTQLRDTYDPKNLLKQPPAANDITLPMLLANQTHLGHATSLWHPGNSSYIFGVREGIHIISLEITFAHLRRAAKVVQEVARQGGIILFVGTRKGWDEIVVNSAKMAGGCHIFDRWTPGCLTNAQQILANCAVRIVDSKDNPLEQFDALLRGDKQVLRPDLVICLNPIENEICLHECGLYNVPTIGVVDTDCNPSWVTYPIPANDDSLRSIGLISGVLGRAGQDGQRLRLEQAQHGRMDYDGGAVHNYIEMLKEVQALDVNEADGGGGSGEAAA